MANRKVRLVRSVKLDAKWKFLSLERGRKLKIPDSEGRWYISWREGQRTRWKLCKDRTAATFCSGTCAVLANLPGAVANNPNTPWEVGEAIVLGVEGGPVGAGLSIAHSVYVISQGANVNNAP